ncbi:hypothetical protein [Marininema halotolerans]|uniref:Uncharacterized protein n=1 Tax=Marininema halotolerans TaxID=1155944 RepID=A0A1I6NXP7_9BACL|nr:hypothetical protein [Marininema halotolerans]SFS32639.1 hypothetical protein SAMN05444972_101216 [Marininema halotolerans]
MGNRKLTLNKLSLLSFVLMIIGILLWLIYIFIPQFSDPDSPLALSFPLWVLTWIINPIGALIGVFRIKKDFGFSLFCILGNIFVVLFGFILFFLFLFNIL